MIIKSLTIENFRNYSGFNSFDLTTSENQNIVLIGGRNGAGKTSLADAIRLCLYGHKAEGQALSEAKYQEYLSNVCSKKGNANSFHISMELILDEGNPPIEINITRRFIKKGSKFNEELILRKSGSDVEFIDKSYWSYYIEKLISPKASRYFFFDGEKVKDIIASSNSKDYLQNAVFDLSGISELNNLKADLKEVVKRILSKTKKKSSLARIDNCHFEIEELVKKKDDLNSDIDDMRDSIIRLEEEKSVLSQERSRLIGSSESKMKKIVLRIDELNRNFNEADQKVTDFCFNRLIYKLADRAISSTVEEARSENKGVISKYSSDTIRSIRDRDDMSALLGIPEDKGKEILDRLISHIESSCNADEESLLDLTLSKVEQIDSMHVSSEESELFLKNFIDREFYAQEIRKYEKKKAKVEDPSLADVDNKIQEIVTNIQANSIEIDRLESMKETIMSKLSILQTNLRKEERSVVLEEVDRASLENIALVQEKIEERSQISLMESKQKLTKKINEMYHVLKNTKDMVKEVRISDSFELQLIDFKDREINKDFISEGEKGILMYSVVYGLHSLSNMKFPVIIDSPLGRMDTLHVNHLATKLFPTVSEQVILLSHDREVIGDNLRLIDGYISHRYLITKYGSPKVKEGYFE